MKPHRRAKPHRLAKPQERVQPTEPQPQSRPPSEPPTWPPPGKLYVTTTEAARAAGLCVKSILTRIHDGRLLATKTHPGKHGHYRIKPRDLERMLDENSNVLAAQQRARRRARCNQ